jgi:hypothetical protein
MKNNKQVEQRMSHQQAYDGEPIDIASMMDQLGIKDLKDLDLSVSLDYTGVYYSGEEPTICVEGKTKGPKNEN